MVIPIATGYRSTQFAVEVSVIDWLGFVGRPLRLSGSGKHYEHFVDVKTGEVT